MHKMLGSLKTYMPGKLSGAKRIKVTCLLMKRRMADA